MEVRGVGPEPAAAVGKAAAVLGAATPDATKPETKHHGRPALGDKPMSSAERTRLIPVLIPLGCEFLVRKTASFV